MDRQRRFPSDPDLLQARSRAGATHQSGLRAATAAAPARAAASLAKRPKQVAPLPDMRARRQSGRCRSAASTAPTAGAMRQAGASKSLPRAAAQAMNPAGSGGGKRGSVTVEKVPASPLNTAGVETATPGFTSSSQSGGTAGTGSSASPMPDMITGSPRRQTGTSAPRLSARAARSSGASATPHRRTRPRRAAAASAEPPPMPEATGRFLVRVIAAPGVLAARSASARAARSTRLSPSPASPAAKGPSTVKVSMSAGSILRTSPTSAKTTRLSSSW
jgi:hypothetical protein